MESLSDRELLELAAKAAGISGGWGEVHALPQGEIDCTDLWLLDGDDYPYVWNPLTDDGDALRLAVSIPDLNLQLIIAEAWQAHDCHESRMAYVRRAIVRAAAAIGAAMQ